jgi:hypothetical protein
MHSFTLHANSVQIVDDVEGDWRPIQIQDYYSEKICWVYYLCTEKNQLIKPHLSERHCDHLCAPIGYHHDSWFQDIFKCGYHCFGLTDKQIIDLSGLIGNSEDGYHIPKQLGKVVNEGKELLLQRRWEKICLKDRQKKWCVLRCVDQFYDYIRMSDYKECLIDCVNENHFKYDYARLFKCSENSHLPFNRVRDVTNMLAPPIEIEVIYRKRIRFVTEKTELLAKEWKVCKLTSDCQANVNWIVWYLSDGLSKYLKPCTTINHGSVCGFGYAVCEYETLFGVNCECTGLTEDRIVEIIGEEKN